MTACHVAVLTTDYAGSDRWRSRWQCDKAQYE
ncbi:hypothetical protein Tco_0602165, partial [Tanacetum coccineum]